MVNGIYGGLTQYGDPAFASFLRRSFLSSAGYDGADLGRPVVGIADTSSDYTTCHRQMPEVIEAIRRGILEAGGLPFVVPTMSLPEILMTPTSMLYRNLMAMETEELIRALPMDAVVLVGGCDKTVPAQLMAAVSADLPALVVVAGPMMPGSWRGQRVGACTDCRALWGRFRAGELDQEDIDEASTELVPTAGTCGVMGTASTMACMSEAMGMMLSGGATAPAATGDRLRTAVQSGRRAVALATTDHRPSRILTRGSFTNACAALVALGGSTNAVIHLLAIARRAGIEFGLGDVEAVAREVPLLVDVKPAGSGYLADLHAVGGMPVVLKALEPLLDTSARTVTGETLATVLAKVEVPSWQNVVRSMAEPLGPTGGLAVLTGSLAPDGAVIKAAAATRDLLRHRGPALVFESPEDAERRAGELAATVTPDHVLVLRNGGPVASGMPEAGSLPIPQSLARRVVKDMVRVSDARMSGTAFGTVVLHCAPEAAVGGPIGLVRNGDIIELDVENRRIDLLVEEREMAARRDAWVAPPTTSRGWRRLCEERVQQANLGADLDFLTGC
jgi:dihydroxy-acid dehydratase